MISPASESFVRTDPKWYVTNKIIHVKKRFNIYNEVEFAVYFSI